MQFSVYKEPLMEHHRTYPKSLRSHNAASIAVLFECENDAARQAHVAMARHATLQELETRAHTLFASSVPEKLRGVRVTCTINGYVPHGPLSIGEIYDAVVRDGGALRVFCSRVLTLGRHSDF